MEQAREELARAERLLKARYANTQLVVKKQVETAASLEGALAKVGVLERKVSVLERTVKERDRMVEKYKGLCVSKDKEIEALKGRLGERKRVACPRTPSEDVEGGVEGGGPSAGTTAAAAAAGMGKKKKKRKGEGVEGNVVGRHLEVLEEMMEAVLMGGEPSHWRVHASAGQYVRELPVDANVVAEAAFELMVEKSVAREVVGAWARASWSPSRWVKGDGEGEGDGDGEVTTPSLVATWCEASSLRRDYVPWLLACLWKVEALSGDATVLGALQRRCEAEVLGVASGGAAGAAGGESERESERGLLRMCCAATVVAVVWRLAGQGDVKGRRDEALKVVCLLLDRVAGEKGGEARVALAMMADAWPELLSEAGVKSIADAVPSEPCGTLYRMAAAWVRKQTRKKK